MDKVGQKKAHSLLEVCLNILIGYAIALTGQLIVFPTLGIYIDVSTHALIGVIFTAISIVRSYSLRRFFNYLHVKEVLK